MPTQTYCTDADVEFVLSEAGVTARVDDQETGTRSTAAEGYIDTAIARAAREINGAIRHQYKLSDVASNEWLKDVNATLAADILCRRRGNAPIESIMSDVQSFREMLAKIKDGREQIPEQLPSFDARATVSNVEVQLNTIDHPVRTDVLTSTGPAPVAPVKRFPLRRWF